MKNLVLLFVCATVLAACGQQESAQQALNLKIDPSISQADAVDAARAVESFNKTCPGIRRYSEDLSQGAPVKISPANLTDERERGWKKSASVEIVVANPARNIPADFHAAGNRCYFDLGVSEPFGVSISKRACISICLDKKAEQSLLFVAAHQ